MPGVLTSLKLRLGAGSPAFFFNDTATTEIYALSLLDALPISAITGALMSCTLIVWLAGAETLPHASVAVQVRFTLQSPAQQPLTLTSFKLRLGTGSHASVAVATPNTGVAGQAIVLAPGDTPIT